jgi:hypothetical protein
MAKLGNHGPRYTVHGSGKIAETIRRVQRLAKEQGRGQQALAAIKEIVRRLQEDPNELGEPLYGLSVLGLEVRTCAIRPVAVDFAVDQERFLVFIKGVKLLTDVG